MHIQGGGGSKELGHIFHMCECDAHSRWGGSKELGHIFHMCEWMMHIQGGGGGVRNSVTSSICVSG